MSWYHQKSGYAPALKQIIVICKLPRYIVLLDLMYALTVNYAAFYLSSTLQGARAIVICVKVVRTLWH